MTDNPKKYTINIQNRIRFKIDNFELLTPETMKLLPSTKNKITKDKNDDTEPHLEVTEVVLVHFNIISNYYQKDSKVLYEFVPNKSFGRLLGVSPENLIF